MPVITHSNIHFQTPPGPPPGSPAAPTLVTSITKDAGATVSFLPGNQGSGGAVTTWTVTPYIGGAAQTPQPVAAASATTITASDSNTYTQVPVTSLANGTAYTFTVHGTNSAGAGAESAASGANTPLSGLVFGDDFNGPAGGPIDPEWWVYTRCGWLSQSEVQYYLPSQVALDGSGNLRLTAEHTSYTGPRYPSDPSYPGDVTQAWRTGSIQSNTRTYAPSTAGNTVTFEMRLQVMADSGNGFWPAFWLEGQYFLDKWKTDPLQTWNDTDQAEIDVAEWNASTANMYRTNVYLSGTSYQHVVSSSGLAAGMHTYQARWKPGVSVSYWQDGSQTTSTGVSPGTGAQMFLMFYIQMLSGGPVTTESCLIDWCRVYDQNLG